MAKLSILIPAEDCEAAKLNRLIDMLLSNPENDLEIIVGTCEGGNTRLPSDKRLAQITLQTAAPRQEQWNQLVEASKGGWVCLVHPHDAVEPDLPAMLAFVETANAAVDAFGWNALEIDARDTPDSAYSIAVPTEASIAMMDKGAMLKAFFMWENSTAVPRMPFGLYHAAIKRSLAETVISGLRSSGRNSALPRYEWATRVLLTSRAMAFANRPMSAIDRILYKPASAANPASPFPLNSDLGITGAIAEIQHAVLSEMGANWGAGAEAAFVRACAIDCIGETERDKFDAKNARYRDALSRWNPGAGRAFSPQFSGGLPKEKRQGLIESALFINRFIGGARDAQAFFQVLRSFLQPVSHICS